MSTIARVSRLVLVVSLFAVAAMAQIPPLGVVSGRVTGDGGGPIAEARVNFTSANRPTITVTTAADGTFTTQLATARWQANVQAAGYIRQF